MLEESEKLSSDDLDEANRLYQPYINQLMSLKAHLKSQLQEIDDSRAFMSLGVAKGSSDAAIKKAYHSKAVKLHPDKPGGDKEKFQKLHDMYQDVLKRRREETAVEEAALKAMDTPESRAEVALVKGLVAHMQECMGDIQRSASECTQIAQMSVRWQKMVDAAARLPHPRALKKLHRMVTADMDMTLPAPCTRGTGCPVNVHNNAATLLLGPIETISRAMHEIVTSAMQILKSGERYGTSAGSDMSFMKRIEYAAKCGMALQQCTSSLYPVENQILMCIDRIDQSMDCALDDDDIYNVLVRMLSTVFTTRSVTLASAADHAVTAAISAADLILAVKDLVKSSDEEVLEKARHSASVLERETDYCAEDLAAMAAAREQESMNQRDAAEKKQAEADKAKEEGREDEFMKTQIQSLQMQLRMQYIEALQTLNAETRDLQKRIVAEVGSTVQEVANTSELRIPPIPTPSDASEEKKKKPPAKPVTLKDSLFSLLAEFVDSSCTSLRNDLRELQEQKQVTDGAVAGLARGSLLAVEDSIESHLGWMCSLGGSEISNTEAAKCEDTEGRGDTEMGTDGLQDGQADKPANETLPPPPTIVQRSVKLALQPDYRSKILWLAVMVDPHAVQGMVRNELAHRLQRDCITAMNEKQDDFLIEHVTATFCEQILRGVEYAATELPTATQHAT